MAIQNSPIQPKGIGKNSKRHDLSGTPGFTENSDLQYGDVKKLEAGQRSVQNTQGQGPPPVAGGGPVPTQGGAPVQVPDPVSFATKKLGSARPDLPTEQPTQIDTSQFLPLLRTMATSGASPLLMKSYARMIAGQNNRTIQSGGTTLIDMQRYDSAVEKAF